MKYLNITLKHLRTFVIVARYGSFNKAAEELSRTQPAITLSVKQLENFIGLKLLDRTTRRVTPTAEGENFIPIAERLVRDFDTAISDLKATAERRVGNVSMAIVPSVATNLLPPIIKTFSINFPGINLHLNDDTSRVVQRKVERNQVDFGIGSVWQQNRLLNFRPLFADNLELVCHRDHHLAASTDPIHLNELANETFLDTGITKTMQSRQSLGPSKFDFPNITTLIAMLKSNLGISILPSLAIPRETGELVSRRLIPGEKRDICLITRNEWTLSPAAEAMIETVIAELPAQLSRLGLSTPNEGRSD
ncbi:MAG: LysR family transcriptional regulator [Proteobacteria bacterium]|jgi:LysR family transcriptional regulator, carnitine catabolism transcriptional activator|nr:LysR family transcriptional regulator [Pseudomonadota bacterium]MDA1351265.1 LysR family transcriptional regulator [Pseudomonadota bacterium]